jgi:hypothetical protein
VRKTATPKRLRSLSYASDDQTHIRVLLGLHARRVARPQDLCILDVTYADGTMWAGLPWQPTVCMSLVPGPGVHLVGDFRDLTRLGLPGSPNRRHLHLPDDYFDVVVFDPPFLPDAKNSPRYRALFGTDGPDLYSKPNISHLFPPFLREARRVLRPRSGIILCKMQNIQHRGALQMQVVDFINAVRATPGLRECDYRIRPAEKSVTMVGHNWGPPEEQKHLRRYDTWWICVRRGTCVRPD